MKGTADGPRRGGADPYFYSRWPTPTVAFNLRWIIFRADFLLAINSRVPDLNLSTIERKPGREAEKKNFRLLFAKTGEEEFPVRTGLSAYPRKVTPPSSISKFA